MMTERLKTFFVSIFVALCLSAGASAQITLDSLTTSEGDPTAPGAIVEFGGPDPLVIQTSNGPVSFTVELAETDAARTRGMMFRESIAPDEGILFDFEVEANQSIWMRNTQIPLDIIYVRADGSIAKIIANAVPYSLRPLYSDYPVLSVLEIAGGRADELGIEPGDVVEHAWFGTVSNAPPVPIEDAEGATETAEGG